MVKEKKLQVKKKDLKEELEKKVQELTKENARLTDEVHSLARSVASYKGANTTCRRYSEFLLSYKRAVEDFNEKPWYKRIFAKKIVVE